VLIADNQGTAADAVAAPVSPDAEEASSDVILPVLDACRAAAAAVFVVAAFGNTRPPRLRVEKREGGARLEKAWLSGANKERKIHAVHVRARSI